MATNTYEAKYHYVRSGSSGRILSSLQVKAETEQVAYKLAENQAKGRHPNSEIYILELKKR